jgi:hypothetical protein
VLPLQGVKTKQKNVFGFETNAVKRSRYLKTGKKFLNHYLKKNF